MFQAEQSFKLSKISSKVKLLVQIAGGDVGAEGQREVHFIKNQPGNFLKNSPVLHSRMNKIAPGKKTTTQLSHDSDSKARMSDFSLIGNYDFIVCCS
jgi:hypothetical protein